MAVGKFNLTRACRERIASAIKQAESRTSGEIVVRVVPSAKGAPREHAIHEFHRLGLEKTHHRTGVLLYIAVKQQAIEVLGDAGIHAKVPDGFWHGIVGKLSEAFKAGRYADGICVAVGDIGEHLAKHFPHHPDDRDMLPDSPIVGP